MRPGRRSLLLLGLALTTALPAAAQARPRLSSPPSLPPARGYSHIAEVPAGTRLVFISGQVPLDHRGELVGRGDFRRQAEQVFTNLGLALEAAGAEWEDVVKLTIFVTDASRLRELREVRDGHVNPASPPASSLVEVRRLFRDDIQIEIEAVAAVPEP